MKKIALILFGLTLHCFQVFAQGAPQLPQVYLNTCVPTTTITRSICSSGCDYNNNQLQMAIDSAAPGTTLMLEPNFIYNGTFNLPEKTGTGAIVIRSATPDANLPNKDTRITPSYSSVMPKIMSTNAPTITTSLRAHNYFFLGVEFLTTGFVYNIINIGSGETSMSDLPHDITFDRVYIHGHATAGSRRGIGANGKNIGVVNSYISDCKEVGADAQAIACWNGTIFKIVNNYLEGSGENVLFGGADPTVPNLVPTDIEFKNNHLKKPLTWYINDSSYLGTKWSVKNTFELKNAVRVLIEGNIFENNWVDAQSGLAIVFTPRNQSGNSPWSQVADVTFRKNIIKHVASAINILGEDDIYTSLKTMRVSITDNVIEDVNPGALGGGGRVFQIIHGVDYLTIEHNTIFNTPADNFIAGDDSLNPNPHFIFRNNILSHGTYGAIGGGYGMGNPTLNGLFPSCIFTKNVITDGGNPNVYPANNYFISDYNAVGFVNYNNGNGGDYHLTNASAYRNLGTDGKDIGANIDSVNKGTMNVLAGVYISCMGNSTAINSLTDKTPFSIYPNPSNGLFTMTMNTSAIEKIEILNILGKKIQDILVPGSATLNIDLSEQAEGVYFIRLKTSEGYSIQKVIVQK